MDGAEAIHTRQPDPYSAAHHPALPPRPRRCPPRSSESPGPHRRPLRPRDSQRAVGLMSSASSPRKVGIGYWDVVHLWAAEAYWPEP